VSDPTPPTNGPDPVDNHPSDQASEVDSGPIDVNELLESTRKLFEPEELQRSMEQAGYTPEPPRSPVRGEASPADSPIDITAVDTVAHIGDHPDVDSVDQEKKKQPVSDSDETTLGVEAQHDVADESDGDDAPHENPPLKGVNVLSIVAFVLALSLSPLAVIFGYIALGQTRRAYQRGETLALWAIGLGWVVFAAWVVLIASLVWIGNQQGITLDSLRDFIDLFSLP
jgi:hypothetical protein